MIILHAQFIDPKEKRFLAINLVRYTTCGWSNWNFRIKKVMKKETVTNDTLPKNLDYIHLWFLGVDPSVQGKGIGGKFLTELIEKYSSFKSAMCLETSTLRNLPFYEKNGFEVYSIKNFGFDLYFFKDLLNEIVR
jgi:GNAT superfamily N-acetyltransferase